MGRSGEVLRVERVRRTFESEGLPVRALRRVDLTLEAGEFLAIMGPSGCGKSTLLNLVAGLDAATDGDITLAGIPLAGKDENELARIRRTHIGMVFQFFNLLDDLPVLDNVALAAQLIGVSTRQAQARAMVLLDELGIADHREAYPGQLSGGERQRVGVARALMNRPAVLLADEPTGALDSRAGAQVMDLLLDLNQIGQTLLVVTHDQRLADRCATRLVRFADGRVVEHSSVSA
jgi:putative ABC transport system ATP-binding protein